ncbi:IKI3 family-domain-containing protein [Rhodocollybia butyracea]|uniref:IKI3 family-domain-containing protein n=1 Tax=Rhodocollybia butyracea TaxID=206335 RepID=A0A9P5PA38_9AGAR|nr:IKI3 family-domain-containing protein [Rhodocollybia butyracea]
MSLIDGATRIAVNPDFCVNVSATAVDTFEGLNEKKSKETLYIASEYYSSASGKVTVELYKTAIEDLTKVPQPDLLTMFSTTAIESGPQVILLKVIQNTRRLVVIMKTGDIYTVSLDDARTELDLKCRVENGVLAASWSPDEFRFALVTGLNTLVVMTLAFDVQFEALLKDPSPALSTECSPNDDNLPRISWRKDGSYLVVSTISPSHRQLRVYQRLSRGKVSLPTLITGLEHPLSWGSSSIASTKNVVDENGYTQHSVIFFDEKGSTAGNSFDLIEIIVPLSTNGNSPQPNGNDPPDQGIQQVDRLVKEVKWNADSNVLAVWTTQKTQQTPQQTQNSSSSGNIQFGMFLNADLNVLVQGARLGEQAQEQLRLHNSSGNNHYVQLIGNKKAIRPKEIKTPKLSAIEWHPKKPILILTTASDVYIYSL